MEHHQPYGIMAHSVSYHLTQVNVACFNLS